MKSKHKHNGQAEDQNSTSWLTTFNDMVTLLMVFFVLLFSLSNVDLRKIMVSQNALQSGLGILKQGKRISITVKDPQPIKDMSHINTQAEGRSGTTRQLGMQHIIENALERLGADIGVHVIYSEQGAHLSFKDNVLFDFGQADLSTKGYAALNKIAEVIRKVPYHIRVEGHTDNVPIGTDRFPSNWELSTIRAVNVLKYFADEEQIDPRRLSAVGYGESRPLVANDSPRHRAQNRRVEIVVIEEDKK